jgi:indole-3-glycerol phosphate synthase
LKQVRRTILLPILRKEFILDPYQVYEARAAGADAMLLIAGLIPWAELGELRGLAGEIGLDVLLEIHDADDLAPALELRPEALGINNRDLRSPDFKTDLARTEKLLPLVPPETTLIGESGIGGRKDVERLARLGLDAILVGERLMREVDPGAAIHDVLGLGSAAAFDRQAKSKS